MTVRDLRTGEAEVVRGFLAANGWAHRVGNAAHFAELIRNSQRTAVAFDGDAVIGFARGITDGLSNGYLSMVAVAPAHRRKGLGHALVQHVIGDNPDVTWLLRAGRDDAPAFFAALGFRVSGMAMERERRPASIRYDDHAAST